MELLGERLNEDFLRWEARPCNGERILDGNTTCKVAVQKRGASPSGSHTCIGHKTQGADDGIDAGRDRVGKSQGLVTVLVHPYWITTHDGKPLNSGTDSGL